MKKKINKLVFIIPAFILVAVIMINPTENELGSIFQQSSGLKTNDINGGTFSSTGKLYSLSWINWLYECESSSDFFIFANNQWIKVVSDQDLYKTLIGADIQQRSTGATINDFRADTYLKCDYPNSGVKSLIVSGNNIYNIVTGPTDEKNIKADFVSFQAITLPDNVRTKVSEYRFKASDIEPQLIVNSIGSAWVNVLTSHNGNYVMTFTDNSVQKASVNQVVNELRYYVNVLQNVQPTIQDANRENAVIFIDDIIQVKSGTSVKSGTMDLNNGQQIKIKATMRDYRDTDGLPSVSIVGPNINVNINLKLTSINSAKDGLFENTFLIPRDLVGKFTVKMTHPFRSTTSSATFTTIDTGITTTTNPITGTSSPSTTDGQIIQTSTTSSSTGLTGPTVTSKIHYIHRYDKVPDCSIATGECTLTQKTISGVGEIKSITLNSLTDSISFGGKTGVQAVLEEIQLTTVVSADFDTLKNIKRATKSDMIYQATVSPTGATAFNFNPFTLHSPQPNICFGTTSASQCPPNAGMQLDVITIGTGKLEQELKNHGIEPNGQKVKLTVVAIDGTFTVIDQANKEHLGSAKGTTYEYTFTFGATPVNTKTNAPSSSTSCTSSDPSVACECPTGQTLSFSTTQNKLVCVDPTTQEETIATPKSDTTTKTTDPDPHCDTDSQGNVVATYGNVSITSPGCEELFGTPSTTPSTTPSSGGQLEASPDDEVKGSGSSQPLINCEDTFGVNVCALASGKGSDLFTSGGEPDDTGLAVLGILIGIIVIIIIIAVALKRKSAY